MADQHDRLKSALAGRYAIERELGSGGMATVYLAHDERHKRRVAIKVLRPELAIQPDRFLREIRIAAGLTHPHILPLHDSGEVAGSLYYVMPFMEGETLRGRMNRDGQLNPLDALRLGREIAGALDYAHRRGVIHRDIKPENVLLHDGHAVVADFGVARALDAAGQEKLTQTGIAVGTPAYMSPEQATAERTVDGTTDTYALACMLYEAIGGELPFQGDSVQAIIGRRVMSSAPHLNALRPDLPPSIGDAICRATAPDQRDRFPTPLAFVDALHEGDAAPAVRPAPLHRSQQRFSVNEHAVGRDDAERVLEAALARVLGGQGMLVSVAGEAGIGKTTVVQNFLGRITERIPELLVGRGRCSERKAGADAYVPVFEALQGLMDESIATEPLARALQVAAPTWYAELRPSSAGDSVQRAGSHERMQRELVRFLQELVDQRPCVIVFEDVHWADASTIDLLAYLGAQFDTVPVFVIVTYRAEELRLNKHPFRQVNLDFQSRGIGTEIPLTFLTEQDIAEYLSLEYPDHQFPATFGTLIHRRTEGSPLFMVDLVRYLHDQQVLVQVDEGWRLTQPVDAIDEGLPQSVRSMIERKVDRLSEDQNRLLSIASVQGDQFHSLVVADVLAVEPDAVERELETLDRDHGLIKVVDADTFPDQAFTVRYQFVHVLYQNALIDALSLPQRARWSAAVAGTLLEHYADNTRPIGADVAFLFDTARDWNRAAEFYARAAQHANEVFAYHEGATLARRGLAAVEKLPQGKPRLRREFDLQMPLGAALRVTRGFAAREVGDVFNRARDLGQQLGDVPGHFRALWSLWIFFSTFKPHRAMELAAQLLEVAAREQDDEYWLQAHHAVWQTATCLGNFRQAARHVDAGLQFYESEQHQVDMDLYGSHDPAPCALVFKGVSCWMLGRLTDGEECARDAMARTEELRHPFSSALTTHWVAMMHQLRDEPADALRRAREVLDLAEEYGFTYWRAVGTILEGWGIARGGEGRLGRERLVSGLALFAKTGAKWIRPYYFGLLADVDRRLERLDDALRAVQQGLAAAEETGEGFYVPELHRMLGDLSLVSKADIADVEPHYRKAVGLAQEQNAKSLELRAATSLVQLLKGRDRIEEVRDALQSVVEWFPRTLESDDLRNARELLRSLG